MKLIRWKELGIAVAVVALNAFIVLQVTGVAYSPFTWKAYAGVYDPGPSGGRGPDTDGDGIPDTFDPDPADFDPSGCFYNLDNGQIVPGGNVSASGPGTVTYNPDAMTSDPMDGSLGCYSFTVDMAGTYTIVITAPANCVLASDIFCANQGNLNIGAGQLLDIGNPPDINNPGFLTSNACTPYYTSLTFADTSFGVINNNFPLDCEPTQAPAMSAWGMALVMALLIAVSFFGLRRRTTEEA